MGPLKVNKRGGQQEVGGYGWDETTENALWEENVWI